MIPLIVYCMIFISYPALLPIHLLPVCPSVYSPEVASIATNVYMYNEFLSSYPDVSLNNADNVWLTLCEKI